MDSLLYLAGAAGVTGILFATENVPSRELANEWAENIPNFFCKVGKGPEEEIFKLGAENFYPILAALVVFSLLAFRYIKFLPLKVVAFTVIIYVQTIAVIGFMRHSSSPQVQSICNTLASRANSSLQTEAQDLIVPFLRPIVYLPEEPFTDDLAKRTYNIIYPHLAEYCLTIQPYLPYAFLVLGALLELRPVQRKFWHYLPVVGAIISFATMAVAHKADYVSVDPYDVLLNTGLQYAIFYIATFILLSIYMILFRLGMRRVSVLSAFLVLSRLHILGLPHMDFQPYLVLVCFIIALLVAACEFSAGTFALFAMAAHYLHWNTIEWGLVAMLADNFLHRLVSAFVRPKRQNRRSPKTKKE